MNVGFALLTLFPGRVGGSETNVRGLLREFAAVATEPVTVLANRHVVDAYAEYAHGPVRLEHVRSYRPGDSNVTRALAMLRARAQPRRVARGVPDGLDLVHYPVTVPIPKLGIPRVVTLYDVQHHDLPAMFGRAERRFRRWAYDRAAQRADRVITTTQYSKARIVDLLGVESDRVEVIPLGIDGEQFRPESAGVALPADLPARYVLYPANLWPHKNHARLIDALALATDRDVALVLTGATYGGLDALLARAAKLGVRDRVRHLGHIQPMVLAEVMRRADALVFPSLYEGFGTPPLEAMACHIPVASSLRAGLAETCQDAVLELDPEHPESIAAGIDRILSDHGLRGALRAAGSERAKSFSWRTAAERHFAVYSDVFRDSAPKAL